MKTNLAAILISLAMALSAPANAENEGRVSLDELHFNALMIATCQAKKDKVSLSHVDMSLYDSPEGIIVIFAKKPYQEDGRIIAPGFGDESYTAYLVTGATVKRQHLNVK